MALKLKFDESEPDATTLLQRALLASFQHQVNSEDLPPTVDSLHHSFFGEVMLGDLRETTSEGLLLARRHRIGDMLNAVRRLCKFGIVACVDAPYFHSLLAFASPPADFMWPTIAEVAFSQIDSATLKSGAFNSIRY